MPKVILTKKNCHKKSWSIRQSPRQVIWFWTSDVVCRPSGMLSLLTLVYIESKMRYKWYHDRPNSTINDDQYYLAIYRAIKTNTAIYRNDGLSSFIGQKVFFFTVQIVLKARFVPTILPDFEETLSCIIHLLHKNGLLLSFCAAEDLLKRRQEVYY